MMGDGVCGREVICGTQRVALHAVRGARGRCGGGCEYGVVFVCRGRWWAWQSGGNACAPRVAALIEMRLEGAAPDEHSCEYGLLTGRVCERGRRPLDRVAPGGAHTATCGRRAGGAPRLRLCRLQHAVGCAYLCFVSMMTIVRFEPRDADGTPPTSLDITRFSKYYLASYTHTPHDAASHGRTRTGDGSYGNFSRRLDVRFTQNFGCMIDRGARYKVYATIHTSQLSTPLRQEGATRHPPAAISSRPASTDVR